MHNFRGYDHLPGLRSGLPSSHFPALISVSSAPPGDLPASDSYVETRHRNDMAFEEDFLSAKAVFKKRAHSIDRRP
jgi:hypothetical protein